MTAEPEPVGADPLVAVVSVTYNRYEPLLVLFGQLRELDYDLDQLDIFLVDNASTDDTVEQVRSRFPEVNIIEHHENSGVAAGFNMSIQAALAAPRPYKYLWLLDSDAEVEPATLKIMIDAMQQDAAIAVAGSSVYDPNQRERLVTSGLRVDWKRGDIPLFIPTPEERGPVLDVDLIPACSMLTRAAVYPDVGLWDTRFPLYWGDTDWCTRVQRAGWRVCCTTASRVWHRDWSTVARGFGADVFIRDHLRGALLYFIRHDPDGRLRGARFLMFKMYVKSGIEHLAMRDGYARAYRDASGELLEGRFDRSFQAPTTQTASRPLGELAAELARILPDQPRILLNRIRDPVQRHAIKAALEPHLERAQWLELADDNATGKEWVEYRTFKPREVWQHLLRMLSGLGRPDLAVCDISTPFMYNFLAGRHVLLLDAHGRGVIERASVTGRIFGMLGAVLAGLKATAFDLPRQLRKGVALRAAVAGADLGKDFTASLQHDRPEH